MNKLTKKEKKNKAKVANFKKRKENRTDTRK